MSLIFFVLSSLLVADRLLHSTHAVQPFTPYTIKLDDISALGNTFEAIIDRIRQTVNRFRCPRGWKRLGGSCYYFPNFTSLALDANYTCELLYSNQSHHMQIGNAIEFFYAAHILSRQNLPALMIEIDPKLAQGRKIIDTLMSNPAQWETMKKLYRQFRQKYRRLKEKILDRLNGTGLQFLSRSKKLRARTTQAPSEFTVEDEYVDSLLAITTPSISPFSENNDYDYDYFDSTDEVDSFEEIDDTRSICHQIDWNVLYNHSNVFVLTTYIVSEKTVCSLSDIVEDHEYHHVCEYVSDFCFANILCGTHGQCVNTLSGFKCSCSFLYGGLLCEKISENGVQILAGLGIFVLLTLFSKKRCRQLVWGIIKCIINQLRRCRRACKRPEDTVTEAINLPADPASPEEVHTRAQLPQSNSSTIRRSTIVQELVEIMQTIGRCIAYTSLTRPPDPSTKPTKRDLVRMSLVGGLTIFILTLLFVITTVKHFLSFNYDHDQRSDLDALINDTINLVTQCQSISDYRMGNLIFFAPAVALIFVFSWSVKREKQCVERCDGRPGLLAPIEPFRTVNRFSTATVFGILAFEVLKIFEEALFRTGQPMNHGVLFELLERIALVMLVGLRYYPVLASLQLRNIAARFFACLYIFADIAYTIVREGSCMGFLPLSEKYSAFEDAKIRLELGTWFIVYGLIKNIPHFCFLSYLGAELTARFAYDSIYLRIKAKESIWFSPSVEIDESDFAKAYVTQLLSHGYRIQRMAAEPSRQSNTSTADQGEVQALGQPDQSRVKRVLDFVYKGNDTFRFTTMATCTYTVAIVFLYYLTCTFIFLYISRTTGHISSLKSFIEYIFQIELEGPFSLRFEVILSAVLTALLYGGQLFVGMQNYKKHKMQLYKGIYEDIPLPTKKNINRNNMASYSVHYSGFLVGYMAWGYVICFHLILIITILFRLVSLQIYYIELVLTIGVPILVVYLLKMASMSSMGKFLLIQQSDSDLLIKNRKTYATFIYFSFFADCFLGIASCIIRLLKGVVLNLVFMVRLDWSFLGRPLEKFDVGFATYVSYLHIEVAHTHPVMLAFCHSVFEDIRQRRAEKAEDDQYCIAGSELESEEKVVRMKRLQPADSSLMKRRNHRSGLNPSIEPTNETTSGRPVQNMGNHDQRLSHAIDTDGQSHQSSSLSVQVSQSSADATLTQKKQRNQTRKEANHGPNPLELKHQASLTVTSDPLPPVPRRQDVSSTSDQSDHGHHESDDGTSSQQRSPHRRKAAGVQKKDPPETKRTDDGDGDDQSTQSKTRENRRTRTTTKTNPESEAEEDEEHDSTAVSDNDSIQMIQPAKQSKSDTKSATTKRRRKRDKKPSNSHNTIDQIVSSPKQLQPVPSNEEYASIPVKSERSAGKVTTTSTPSSSRTIQGSGPDYLRTKSYRQAQQASLPADFRRSEIIPSTTDHAGIKPNRHSEPTPAHDIIWMGISNRSYSPIGPCQTTPNVEHEQIRHDDLISAVPSPPAVPAEHSASEDKTVEEPDEEDGRDNEQDRLLLNPQQIVDGREPITSQMNNDMTSIKRRRRARFRWHFIYTIIHNYHLLDLRKNIQSRLAFLHMQRSQMVYDQQTPLLVTDPQSPVAAEGRTTWQMPVVAFSQPFQRSLSVTTPGVATTNYPQSPAERYVDTRVRMFYDGIVQSASPLDSFSPPHPSTVQPAMVSSLSSHSIGFPVVPHIVINAPSSEQISPSQVSMRPSATLSFLPAMSSNQSTAAYPLTPGSSIANSGTLRSQMSLDQHMQVWQQRLTEKIQRKRRYRYVYGPLTLPSPTDKLSTATILTPRILPLAPVESPVSSLVNVTQAERQPSPSPFMFPLRRGKPRNSPTTHPSVRQPAVSRQDAVRQPPIAEKTQVTTSALVHQSDSSD